MQLLTYETMFENIGLTDAKNCETCSLLQGITLHNFLTYKDVSVSIKVWCVEERHVYNFTRHKFLLVTAKELSVLN